MIPTGDQKRNRTLDEDLADVEAEQGPGIAALVRRMIEDDDHVEQRGTRAQFDGKRRGRRRLRGAGFRTAGGVGRTLPKRKSSDDSSGSENR